MTESIPMTGRLAGVDYGSKRVGLAISDPSQTWVTPHSTYQRTVMRKDLEFLAQFSETEGIVAWVVGLPIHCDGEESQLSRAARDFAEKLSDASKRQVTFFDERFTSAEASRLMSELGISRKQKKERIDQIAAHLILSHFLDGRKRAGMAEPLDDQPR